MQDSAGTGCKSKHQLREGFNTTMFTIIELGEDVNIRTFEGAQNETSKYPQVNSKVGSAMYKERYVRSMAIAQAYGV